MSVPHRTFTVSVVMVPSCALPRPLADPVRREAPVLPHQPPHPSGRAADPGKPQPRPDLAVTLAGEAAIGDRLLDVRHQRGVVAGAHGAGTTPRRWGWLAMAIHGRSANIPAAADPRQAIRDPRRARPPGSSPRPPPC